ncbi:MAG: SUMF1/EgtB/PvdO family nonheme iron enzyme [Prolixibacteraceae bacterium]|jgi:formylglycine-generating enzyme required for sulfatase activity|nr:SUMF1/EgtB/PvdO family nonheme iron enzyme [Prolixibacteraceae bacterium]
MIKLHLLIYFSILLVFFSCKQKEQTVANYYEPAFDQTGKQYVDVSVPKPGALDSNVLVRSNIRDTRLFFSDTITLPDEFYFDFTELMVPVDLINAKPPTFDTFLVAREYLYSRKFVDDLFPVLPDSVLEALGNDTLYASTVIDTSGIDNDHPRASFLSESKEFYSEKEILADTTRDLFMADTILADQLEIAPWKINDSIPYFENMETVFVDSTLRLLLDTVYVEVFDSSKIIPQMSFDEMCNELADTISRTDTILWDNEVTFRIFYPGDVDVFVDMVYVSGGTFTIGSNYYDEDERPATRLRVSRFLLSKHEVTNKLFCYFLNDMEGDSLGRINGIKIIDIYHPLTRIKRNPFTGEFSAEKGWENYPVVNVSWIGAQMFCKMTGGRLPTEAEWEYAARGGKYARRYYANWKKSETEYEYLYAGGNHMYQLGWFVDNSRGGVWKVGIRKPNELGLYDMSGNVWEWCYDKYQSNFYARNGDSTDPMCLSGGDTRVNRGGCWSSDATYCRIANRNYLAQYDMNPYLGFRLMRPFK